MRHMVVVVSLALAATRAALGCEDAVPRDAPEDPRRAPSAAPFASERRIEDERPICSCDAGVLKLTLGDAAPILLRHETPYASCRASVPVVSAQCGTQTNSIDACAGTDGGLPCVAFRGVPTLYGRLDLDGSPMELWDGSFAVSKRGETFEGRFTACAAARDASAAECPLPVEGLFETCAFVQGSLTCR